MSNKRIDEKLFDEIITRHFAYGQTAQSVADALGVSRKSVLNICRVFRYVRDNEFDKLAQMIPGDNSMSEKSINLAAQKLGVTVPSSVLEAFEQRSIRREQTEQKVEQKDEVKEQIVEKKNDALYMIKILEALNKQNELLEQLMDVVIPKYVSDMKDNVNANADVICERLKNCEQSLDAIRCNSRKRGL